MPGILSSMRDILDNSREIGLFSDRHGYTPMSFESSKSSQLPLHLPEVWTPAQYLIDMGLRPSLARQLSSTYMDVVARYRETCQSYFDLATRGGHLAEYCREVFIVLFRRTTQAWGSKIVSVVRVQLCQAGARQATVRPERVDIRVDDAVKAKIIARLGLKATHLTSDRMARSPCADVTSRLEEVSEHPHALSANPVDSRLMMVTVEEVSENPHILSADTINSRLMLSEFSPISSTEITFRRLDPFCQPAPQTCFPAPYPPPPEHSLSHSPKRAWATSFVPSVPPRISQPSTSYTPDVSSLADVFDRMTVTTLKTDSTNPRHHRMFRISEFNKTKTVPPLIAANFPKDPQPANMESITTLPKSTPTARRRKIAALPTRRGKTSVCSTTPVSDLAGATSYSAPRVVEEAPPDHISTLPQKTGLVPALPSRYTAEAPCFTTLKSSAPRQRKVLRKTLPQTQPIPQNQTWKPLAMAVETFYNISRSPPLVSDATSYFDSPPTSSDELDTPPSTPPSSHVLLASTSTESLAVSSESDGIVSDKEPLGDAKLPYPRLRYRRLDFKKGGLGRDEQPLTFTFSV